MKFLRIEAPFSSTCKFYMHQFEKGSLYEIITETSTSYVITVHGITHDIDKGKPVETVDIEVPTLVYELWYQSVQTSHIFDLESIPDIRTLGYDINTDHEFKIKMVIR